MRTDSSVKQRLTIVFGALLPFVALMVPDLHKHLSHLTRPSVSAILVLPLLGLFVSALYSEQPSEEPSDTSGADAVNAANLPNIRLLTDELRASLAHLDARNRELQTRNAELARQLSALQTSYEQQRSISVTLQESFLPSMQSDAHGYDIAHRFIAAHTDELVGGDFYDVFEIADGALGVVIGDVSGKGVGATMHAAMAKYMLMAITAQEPDPAKALTQLNDAVTKSVHTDVFVTLFYGVLHTRKRVLVYANAGHEIPILLKAASGECIPLETTGHPIGIFPDCEYGCRKLSLEDGDALLLCTDGITEARNGKDFFGSEGLQKSASEVRNLIASEMVDTVLGKVHEFTGGGLGDDAALMVIKSPTL